MKHRKYVVILAGGEGTRFAPYSTPDKPKQFLPITNSRLTMIQETFQRVASIAPIENVFVSTNAKYIDLVHQQLPQIPLPNIIGEPIKKNTAPAIALLCHIIAHRDPDAVVLFIPSDQYVHDPVKAVQVVESAFVTAQSQNVLNIFGVPPTFPSTAYGYLKIKGNTSPYEVEAFVEKPNQDLAKQYIAHGDYYWNSGMFVWKAAQFLNELKLHANDLRNQISKVPFNANGNIQLDEMLRFYEQVKSISVDYDVMEKSKNIKMLPFDAGWSDVGTWEGLKELIKTYQIDVPTELKPYLQKA